MNALKIGLFVLTVFFASTTIANDIRLKFLSINTKSLQHSELSSSTNARLLKYSIIHFIVEAAKDEHCILTLPANFINPRIAMVKNNNSTVISPENLHNFFFSAYLRNSFQLEIKKGTNNIVLTSLVLVDKEVKASELVVKSKPSFKKEQVTIVTFESFFFGVLFISILLNSLLLLFFYNKSIIQYSASLLMLTLYWLSKIGIISMLFDKVIILNRILDWLYFPGLLLIYWTSKQIVQPKKQVKAIKITFFILIATIPVSIILAIYNYPLHLQLMKYDKFGLLILFILFFAHNYRNTTHIGKRILWFCKLLLFAFITYFIFNLFDLIVFRIITFQTIFIIDQFVWFSYLYLLIIDNSKLMHNTTNLSVEKVEIVSNDTKEIQEQFLAPRKVLLDMTILNSNIDFINSEFYQKVKTKYPEITIDESKLLFYVLIGLKTKDISTLTKRSISSIDVAKSRMRKKIGLQKNIMIADIINFPLLF
jgi:hypothetical protein